MANGWTKYFEDCSCEYGLDTDPGASWSRGRLDGMNAVSLTHGDQHIAISKVPGPGEFWQADVMEATVFLGTHRVARQIMCYIDPGDARLDIYQTEHSTMLRVTVDVFSPPGDLSEEIPQDKKGNWLVLEYDIVQERVRWWYAGSKNG